MATITNLTSGIEVNYGGAVTYIKHGNVKLLKRGTNLNIYDDSDDDGNQRGQVYMSIPFSEVTSPVEADIDALYATVRGYIDVSSGGGGATELNDLTDVTTGLPSTPTEADSGKILYYDFDAGVWQTDDAITAGTNVINGKKASAGTITKGKPVYLVGFDADLHTVEEANAGSSSTMPVIGFAAEDLDNTNSKHIITFGKLTGVNTSIYSVGDILYMDTSTGALTTTRPTGESSLIQRIAKVLKVDATGGQLFVFNTARTAGLPNIGNNKLWVGDSNGIPQSTTKKAVNTAIDNTIASSATLTPNIDEYDQETITALAAALTVNAPTGTASNGMRLIIRIKDNGTARAITWNAIYRAIGVTLPSTTTISKTLYVGCIYNATDTQWDVIAVKEEA